MFNWLKQYQNGKELLDCFVGGSVAARIPEGNAQEIRMGEEWEHSG